MVPPRGWARCLDNVADVLRRGAWYPIIDETSDGKVVIEVRQKPVRLSRIDVTVRETAPDHWSIVVRTGVLRPTLQGRGGRDHHVRRLPALSRAPGLQRQAGRPDLHAMQEQIAGRLVGNLLRLL